LPDQTFEEAGKLDILHIPAGPGQENVMDDDA
jgi:hypothetical protein